MTPREEPRARRRVAALALAALLLGAGAADAAAQEPADEEPKVDEPAPSPRLLIKGFGDVDFVARDDGTPSAFSLGELDLFGTSEITPELSVLAEIAFEPREGSNPEVEIERFVAKYAPRDYLQVAVGRMHTPLGYWNQTFHHGTWFQPTIERPVVYRWEHDGGVLPVHEVGMQVLGSVPLPGLSLAYNASLSNGRGHDAEHVQEIRDANASKAVNLWLSLSPSSGRALQAGGVVRFDRIPAAPDGAGRPYEMDERVLGGFVAYTPRHVEALAEVLRIEHEVRGVGTTYETLGLYVLGAVAFGRLKPYYRYDYLDVDEGDPYYPETGTIERHTVGLRYDPWSWASLKLELVHEDPAAGDGVGWVALQAAFAF